MNGAHTKVSPVSFSIRRQGIAIMVFSAVVFSTAGLFSKGVDAGSWTIIFWRGLFAMIFSCVFIACRRNFRSEFLNMGKPGIAVGIIGAAGTAAFIASFKHTSIANVSLIYATGPLLAAAIAWLWFREIPTKVVIVASIIALGGVLVIVGGSWGGVHLRGDLMALWMTLCLATIMVIYRRYPETPAIGPQVLSSVLLIPASLAFENPFAAPSDEIILMAVFGLVFAIASVTLAEGARRLSPAEASLISALEVPLAPIWAWMVFVEVPGSHTILGGAIILLAVFGSQVWSIRREQPQDLSAATPGKVLPSSHSRNAPPAVET